MSRALLQRLDASDCLLCKEAADFIRAQQKQHREEIHQMDRDAREDARAAAAEARWQTHEDYQNSNGGW